MIFFDDETDEMWMNEYLEFKVENLMFFPLYFWYGWDYKCTFIPHDV